MKMDKEFVKAHLFAEIDQALEVLSQDEIKQLLKEAVESK